MAKRRSITEHIRCPWAQGDQYAEYHDTEWGVPVHDDRRLFEFLILEGAQAGLSWSTILKKRENYREAFDQFDPTVVARYSKKKQVALLGNPGIVRNRLKIESTIANATAFLAVQGEFGSFDEFIWGFVSGSPFQNARKSMKEVPARTPESDAMSKELKKRGFRFVGSTICYAFMQAVGMVNDHLVECFRHAELLPKHFVAKATEWFVYILRCADGTLYTGITNNLVRRCSQHNVGTASRYTRSRLPVEVVYQEPQATRSLALKRELAIKALSRPQKESLIACSHK
jgi:DNA-3-methyladenine glycosylase I